MSENFRRNIKKQHYPVQPSNIKFWTSFRNCVLKTLNKRGWKESEYDNDWDIAWVEKEAAVDIFDRGHLSPHQRVNHFRNHFELTRKDNLIKNLKRHKRTLEKEGKLEMAAVYNFFPTTYQLPNEYSIFTEEFKKNSNTIWIMKPIGKCQGRGIFLFKKLSQISDWKYEPKVKGEGSQADNYVVQKYINNPLLIGGKKFDLRIYCLVTSYSPLTAYLYRDGFARFTHHRYDNDDISNTYIHLTNVAIQKHSENYDKKIGGKWDLRTLKLYLLSKYGHERVKDCFFNIQQLIILTLQSVQKVITNDKHCFELYGFDILIDSDLKPWVIEVNGSPSMSANTKHDCDLKCGLLDDVFTIIDMEKILSGPEEQIGGFDLICHGEPFQIETRGNTTMLGCFNDRTQQLSKMSKAISSRLSQHFLTQGKDDTPKSKKGNSKDTLPSIPIAISTDASTNSKKIRSKSSGKTYISETSSLNSTPSKLSKNSFNQKPNLVPLSRENRSDNNNNSQVKQNKFRIQKGKTVDLPPSNHHLNHIVLTSDIGPVLPQSNPSSGFQKSTGVTRNLMQSNGPVVANLMVSAEFTQVSIPSYSNGKQIQSKTQHQSVLLGSTSSFAIKGSVSHNDSCQRENESPIQLAELFGSGKKEKSLVLSDDLKKDLCYSYEKSKLKQLFTENLVKK